MQTKAALDFETKSSYSLTVEASDGTDSDTVDVTLTVTDENEPPAAPGAPAVAATSGTSTGLTVTWAAPTNTGKPPIDDYDVRYGTDGTNWTELADATNSTARTVDITSLTASTSYQAQVRAGNDEGDGPWSASGTGSTTSAVNRPPEFGRSHHLNVDENLPAGSTVNPVISVFDRDGDTISGIRAWGSDIGFFSVVFSGESLVYVKTKAPMDAEARAGDYGIAIEATDAHGASFSQSFKIRVNDLEEAGTITLSPKPPKIDTAVTATLTDADGGVTGTTWQWAISANGTSGWTNISTATSDSYTPVAADATKYLRVTASYADGRGSGKTAVKVSDNAVVASTVTESAPLISNKPASHELRIAENSTGTLHTFTAGDADNDSVTWELTGTDATSFVLGSSDGALTAASGTTLDYESNKTSFVFTVEASDGTYSDTVAVTLNVADVEEPPAAVAAPTVAPVSGSNEQLKVTWTAPDSTGQTAINDYDVRYKRDGATDWTDMPYTTNPAVTATIGSLRAGTAYEVQVRAGNSEGEGPWSASGTGSTSNTAPVITNKAAGGTLSEAENSTPGTLFTYTATDADDHTITWSVTGTDFVITKNNSGDGELTLASGTTLDHEATPSYSFTVTASDGTDSDTVAVTLTVTNVDEDGVVSFDSANPVVGTALTASLTDPDGNISATAWQWEISADRATAWSDSGTDSASYTPVAGDVGKYLRATASYTDGHGASKTAVAVAANAVSAAPPSNNAPEFPASETGARSVAENTAAATDIGDPVAATDADAADTLTYTLGGTDVASFAIVAGTGQLQTKAALDYEDADNRTYTVVVTATDTSNETDTITVTISVTNVDEAGAVSFSATTPVVGAALTASLTDPDGNISGTTWQWAISADGSAPWSDIGTDSASYTPVAGDVGKYLQATASYTDDHGGSKTADGAAANAVVAAAPANNAPEITNKPTNGAISVAENTTGTLYTFNATDADSGDTITWSLTGTDPGFFEISSAGVLTPKSTTSLDFESAKTSYSFTVEASDGTDTDTVDVTLTVTDVAEPPAAPGAPAVAATSGTSTGLTVTWTAPANTGKPAIDDYDVRYGTDGTNWTELDDTSKSTALTVDITGLTPGASYQAQVRAGNAEGDGPWSASGTGSTSSPGNTAPEITNKVTGRTLSIAENTSGTLYTFTATDANADTITWRLTGGDATSFRITGGKLTLASGTSLDYETKNRYSFTVEASDGRGGSDTVAMTLMVTNVDEPFDNLDLQLKQGPRLEGPYDGGYYRAWWDNQPVPVGVYEYIRKASPIHQVLRAENVSRHRTHTATRPVWTGDLWSGDAELASRYVAEAGPVKPGEEWCFSIGIRVPGQTTFWSPETCITAPGTIEKPVEVPNVTGSVTTVYQYDDEGNKTGQTSYVACQPSDAGCEGRVTVYADRLTGYHHIPPADTKIGSSGVIIVWAYEEDKYGMLDWAGRTEYTGCVPTSESDPNCVGKFIPRDGDGSSSSGDGSSSSGDDGSTPTEDDGTPTEDDPEHNKSNNRVCTAAAWVVGHPDHEYCKNPQ